MLKSYIVPEGMFSSYCATKVIKRWSECLPTLYVEGFSLIAYLSFTAKRLVWNKIKKHNASSCWNARLVFSTETVGVKLGRLRVLERDCEWGSCGTDCGRSRVLLTVLVAWPSLRHPVSAHSESANSWSRVRTCLWAQGATVRNTASELSKNLCCQQWISNINKLWEICIWYWFVSGSAINKYSEGPM